MFLDDRETAGQGVAERLQLSVPPWDMQSGTCVQEMAANRVRHATVEARIPSAGGQRIARELAGQSAAFDQVDGTEVISPRIVWQILTFALGIQARNNSTLLCQNNARARTIRAKRASIVIHSNYIYPTIAQGSGRRWGTSNCRSNWSPTRSSTNWRTSAQI